MSFVSWQFIVLVFISLIVYYAVPKKIQWVVLLLVSYLFYSLGGISTIGYLLFTTFTTYISGILIGKLNEKQVKLKENKKCTLEYKKEQETKLKRYKKLWVAFACFSNFGILFFLKYWDFTAGIFQKVVSNLNLPIFNIILPLGISFYIFQSIGYVVDVYRKKHSPEKNIFKFALFVSFFPQMVQGPISRFHELGNQLTKKHTFSFESMEKGINLMLWGYFKKLLIADRAAVVVNLVFENYSSYSGAIILFSVILYCIQLYCDFSGGIDITRGVAKLFDISLMDNFKRPIFATSLADFWRRWHISLGTWMKDYLFYPLSLSKPFINLSSFIRKHISGKAGKILPVSIVTFIVYFVIGIWHGASFKYIAFGIWNGSLITISLLLEPVFISMKQKLKITEKTNWFKIFQILRTSLLVLIGRYITRAANLGTAYAMLKTTITNFVPSQLVNSTLLSLGLTLEDFIIIGIGTLIILVIEWLQEKGVDVSKELKSKPMIIQFLVLTMFLGSIEMFGIYRGDYIASEFIYKQF